MSITSPILQPITQPGGLYPEAPPRIKKPSKGSKRDRQKKTKFQKKPELPPISYHVTPYENPDNPPEYKRTGGRFWKVESEEEMPPYKPPPSGDLGKKGKALLSKVYKECREDNPGESPEAKEKCAKTAWSVVKKQGYKSEDTSLQRLLAIVAESPQEMFRKEKKEHGLPDKLTKKLVRDHLEEGVEGQTPHEQDHTPSLQPRTPIMRMTTPDDTKEQRPDTYKSPFPGRNYSPNFPDRNPGEADTNPADLSIKELMERERKKHPDASEQELEELVKLHIRELGEPSNEEHKENYQKTHTASALHFGVDTGIPISHRFKAAPLGDGGDIRLLGTFLDYETTTNGWHIDPNEESNIIEAPTQANVTVRVAHSKEPERVVGKYIKFQANDGDGCTDAYGNSLGRHIDFEAIVNPQDPQLRTNILKGWVNDISPGLDAEVFCGECDEPWGLDQATNKLVKTCEHTEAEGVLRNIKPKEGSIVTEPAFEGRTQFHPTFTFGMAMNALFSPDINESEPVGTRREGRQPMIRGKPKLGGKKIMSNNSERKEGTDAKVQKLYQHGFFTASEVEVLQKHGYFRAEDEDEDKGEDEDEDARIRAAFPLIKKAMKRAQDYQKSLKQLQPDDESRMEDQHKYAEDRAEDTSEDKSEDKSEDRAEDQQKLGPGQLGAMKLSDEEKRIVAQAERIILDDKKAELLGHSNVVLARQQKRLELAELERARKLFESTKNEAGVKAADEHIQKLKAELAPQVASTVQGAQVPGSNPTILATESYGSKTIVLGPHGEKLEVKTAAARPTVNAESFAATFNASLLTELRGASRLRGVSEQAWDRQTRRLQ